METLEWLKYIDTELFLFLNNFHSPVADWVMWQTSRTITWLPLYLLLVWLLVKNYGLDTVYILAAVAVAITLADQTASGFAKPFFERLRPSHELELVGLVHLVNPKGDGVYMGGRFGFFSSHATNTFAVAMLLYRALHKHYKYAWLLLVWAAFVSYSRIYLGVHYPGDILMGVAVGVSYGYFCYQIGMWLTEKYPLAKQRKLTRQADTIKR
jgi:undecaprenyl-diphosphatase